MSSDVLIKVEGVSKKFCKSLKKSLWYGACDIASSIFPKDSTEDPLLRPDEFWALRDISFELKRGECLGLLGHNGAGKSTLLKILNGLIPVDQGRITMRGRVAALIELNAGFNPILSGRENIYNQAALLGFTENEVKKKFESIVEFAEIGEFLNMPVQNYSSGMRVRLGFSVAAHLEPDILIIDEVLAVGDVAFRFKCLNAIGELMKSTAVIFVTHTMPQIYRICSEAMVLDHGRISCHSPNLADAVGAYLSLFKRSQEQVVGSLEVRVVDLILQSGLKESPMSEELEISYGDDLEIRAVLETVSEVSEAKIQFLLWNSEMLPVMDIISEDLDGYSADLSSGRRTEVRARIPRVELNGGKYSITVIAASTDLSRILCRHDNAAFINVRASSSSGAHFLSVGNWRTNEIEAEISK